jgi:hypothetical protein
VWIRKNREMGKVEETGKRMRDNEREGGGGSEAKRPPGYVGRGRESEVDERGKTRDLLAYRKFIAKTFLELGHRFKDREGGK